MQTKLYLIKNCDQRIKKINLSGLREMGMLRQPKLSNFVILSKEFQSLQTGEVIYNIKIGIPPRIICQPQPYHTIRCRFTLTHSNYSNCLHTMRHLATFSKRNFTIASPVGSLSFIAPKMRRVCLRSAQRKATELESARAASQNIVVGQFK